MFDGFERKEPFELSRFDQIERDHINATVTLKYQVEFFMIKMGPIRCEIMIKRDLFLTFLASHRLAPFSQLSGDVPATFSHWASHIYPTLRQSFFGQSLKR